MTKMLRVYFGHHKCASTWIHEIIGQVCREAGLQKRLLVDPLTPHAHGPLTDYRRWDIQREELGAYLQREQVDFACCITADQAQVEGLGGVPFRGFHVIRDPRDIIVSAYFSHRNSHPTEGLPHLAAHRRRLQAVSKEEGLLLEMDFSAQELRDIGSWPYGHPNILELKVEELAAHPYDGFLRIFEFLGLMDWEGDYLARRRIAVFVQRMLNRLSFRYRWMRWVRRPMLVTGELLLGRVYDHRFEKKAGRRRGEEDPKSHYRKGQPGDWRHHFTEEHVAAFKEKFGDLVVRLGYEPDSNWELVPRTSMEQYNG